MIKKIVTLFAFVSLTILNSFGNNKELSRVINYCYNIDSLSSIDNRLCKIEIDRFYQFIKPLNNSTYFSYYHRRLGIYYFNIEDYSKAIEQYQNSAKLSKDNDDRWNLASDYSNIGDIYFQMKIYDKALELYQKAQTFYNETKDHKYYFFMGFCNFQIAKVHFAKKNHSLALGFALDGINLMSRLDNHLNRINKEIFRSEYLLKNHFLLVQIYLIIKDFRKVNFHLEKAKYYITKYNYKNYLSDYFLLISRYKFLSTQGINDLDSIYYFINETKKQGKFSNTLDYYELLKNLSEHNQNYKAMAAYSDSVMYYTNKIYSIDKARSIFYYQSEFETQKAEFETQQAELKTQKEKRKGLFYLVSLFISLLSISFLLYYWKNKQKAQQSSLKIKDLKISSLLHKNELENLNGHIKGQEKERDRIAQDLHDGVGGILASVKMHFNAILSNKNFNSSYEESLFNKANALLDESCTEVRRVSHDLHTTMQKKDGLERQLINLKNAVEVSNKIKISVFYEVEEKRLTPVMEKQLYKITLELMSNTLKHAQATLVNLQIISHDNEIDYIFEDNGKGFNVETINRGLGLTSVEKRVKKIGGILQIDSHKKSGSTFIISILLTEGEKP